jgi:hypothetical protein
MPLNSYTIFHREAVLSEDQKLLIQNWAANTMKEMEAENPAEDLEEPK